MVLWKIMGAKSKKEKVMELVKTRDQLAEQIKEVSINLSFEDELELYIDNLFAYHKKNGTLNIPIREKTDDNLSIGKFVHTKLRPRFKKWKSLDKVTEMKSFWSTLFDFSSKEVRYFRELHNLGFSEKLRDPSDDWEDGFRELEQFFKDNKHSYVKPGTKYGENQYPLGTWVSYQRAQRKSNKLDPVKINRLNQLNFLWLVDLGSIFQDTNTDDSALLETKLNLKKTFDLPVEKTEATFQKLGLEQRKLTDVLMELDKKINEKAIVTHEIRELNHAIKQIESELSKLNHISAGESSDPETRLQIDNLSKVSESLEIKQNELDHFLKSLHDSIDRLERHQSSLTNNLKTMRGDLNKSYGRWSNWGRSRTYRSYADAKKFIKTFGIKTRSDWRKFVKSNHKPDDIPSVPYSVYREEWTSWDDFLGIK